MSQTLVALYDRLEGPEQIRRELETAGVARTDIRISGESEGAGAQTAATQEPRGFWEWLFGAPEEDVTYYREGVERGRTLVTVQAQEQDLDQIMTILERYNPIDVQGERAATATGRAGEEARIPVVEEELKVGKRPVQAGGVRVRSYVVERPAEEQVTLRDEKVQVERRPASGAAPAAGDAFQERSVEVTERHEEPVVEKTARVTEEVGIKKDVRERTETVKDKVRKTEVEVEPTGAPPKRR
ncbi:MAG TPA: YsnF/AvaK domain-containing protein [Alphaproteobacteria bacterium]